ncbi:MAG: S41 family peptidase [bacterium]|nr:S41 family peptidase [bacterium]
MFSEKKGKEVSSKQIGLVVVLALLLGASAFGSYNLGYQSGLNTPRAINVDELVNINQPEDSEPKVDFAIFWEVWDKLRERHPEFEGADKQELIYGAVQGLTDALGDPNTVFFTPDESRRFSEDISGAFTGIGAEIGTKEEQLVIIAPLSRSPAEKAGLLPGDAILAIDGQSTQGLTIDEAVEKIRGAKGTTVTLTIHRDGEDGPRDFSIVRDEIRVPSVETERMEDGILYIRIHNFSANTPLIFYAELLKNAFTPTRGIVLDLRNNPGGFLDVSIEAAGWFMGEGKLVVTEQFSSGAKDDFFTRGTGPLKDLPLVVLVNEGSASASEILAGALRYHKGSLLIGSKTFGKGTVQQYEGLSDGSSIKITVANWLLPDGALIEGAGLEPDIAISQPEDDLINGSDTQLQRAIEALKAQL